jgi:tRNA threonylcarbamoyladenosine biosynthesis protein TsaE
MPEILSSSEKETRAFGAKFAEKLAKGGGKPQTLLLIGDLGSGKTAFSKGFAGFFGVKRVLSPTFNIVKSYRIKKGGYSLLIHADLYRVKKAEELGTLGFLQSIKGKGVLALVEWPEQAGVKIPGTVVRFSHGKRENERLISYN